jgi:hypothetical protein
MIKTTTERTITETRWVLRREDFGEILKDLGDDYQIEDMSKFYAKRLEDNEVEKKLWESGNKFRAMMFMSPFHHVRANYTLLCGLIGRLWFNEGDSLLKKEGVYTIESATLGPEEQ